MFAVGSISIVSLLKLLITELWLKVGKIDSNNCKEILVFYVF